MLHFVNEAFWILNSFHLDIWWMQEDVGSDGPNKHEINWQSHRIMSS